MTDATITTMPRPPSDDLKYLRAMTKGCYDLQELRMQTGLRLVANLRSRLKLIGETGESDGDDDDDERDAKAVRALDLIKASYRRLTDGIVSEEGRTNMRRLDLTGDPLITTLTEFALVDQYVSLERQESRQFRQLAQALEPFPIWTGYMQQVRGVGPAMAAVIIAYLDPHRARHVSGFWMIAGLDVAADGAARSRRPEHLREYRYRSKSGQMKTRVGITFEAMLKTKLVGVLGPSFLRSKSEWRREYDGYKHRIMSDPNRQKCTVNEWKAAYAAYKENPEDTRYRKLWPPKRVHNAAIRYMVKMFLADLWRTWRALEGLPVGKPYREAVLGLPPHGGQAA